MPYLDPHSTASVLVIASTPALALAECITPGPDLQAYVATIFIIRPFWPCLIHSLPTACVQYHVPFNTISTTEFHAFVDKSSAGQIKFPAALFTRPSILPNLFTVLSTVYCTRSGSRTSISMHNTWPSYCSISCLASSNRSKERPVMTTFAPSSANRLAIALPMPLLPPVIIITLSFIYILLLKLDLK